MAFSLLAAASNSVVLAASISARDDDEGLALKVTGLDKLSPWVVAGCALGAASLLTQWFT
jgi:hypothetical protein